MIKKHRHTVCVRYGGIYDQIFETSNIIHLREIGISAKEIVVQKNKT